MKSGTPKTTDTVKVVNESTGEVLSTHYKPGYMVFVRPDSESPEHVRLFAAAAHLMHLGFTAVDYTVFIWLVCRMDFNNRLHGSASEISNETTFHIGSIRRSLRRLRAMGVVQVIKPLGKDSYSIIHPLLLWKGKEKARKYYLALPSLQALCRVDETDPQCYTE